MWLDIAQACGPVFISLSAARDAGIWFIQLNSTVFQNYMESYFISKGKM